MIDVHEMLLAWAVNQDLAEVGLASPDDLDTYQYHFKHPAVMGEFNLPL